MQGLRLVGCAGGPNSRAMYLSARERRVLSRLFGLLAEDMAEHAVRERLGHGLLKLLEADCFASYVLIHSVGHPVVGPGSGTQRLLFLRRPAHVLGGKALSGAGKAGKGVAGGVNKNLAERSRAPPCRLCLSSLETQQEAAELPMVSNGSIPIEGRRASQASRNARGAVAQRA